MKLFFSIIIIIMISASLVEAAPLNFKQAQMIADRNEAALSAEQLERLTLAQGSLASSAFSKCMNGKRNDDLSPFIVVMKLDDDGKVAATWLNGRSKIAVCFNAFVKGKHLFKGPATPFFTAFSMKFSD